MTGHDADFDDAAVESATAYYPGVVHLAVVVAAAGGDDVGAVLTVVVDSVTAATLNCVQSTSSQYIYRLSHSTCAMSALFYL